MANNSPTIVAASLSDDQLKKSIDSLVTHVDEAMKKMVQSTNNAVGEMEAKLKSLGSLKIDSCSSNDGGTGRRTQQHEKLTKAVNDASEAVSKETQKLQDLQQSLSGASDREQNFISQKERAANTIAQENDLLSKQQSELAALKTQEQQLSDAHQKDMQARQQNATAIEKQTGAVKYYEEEIVSLQARLTSAQAKIDRFYEVQAKARESISSRLHAPSDQFIGYNDYERGKSVYSKTEQDVRSLIKALSELDNADKKHGFGDELRRAYMNLTPSQDMANVFKRQQEEISSYIKTLQEAKKGTKGETRANLDNQIAAAKELLTIYKELGNAQNSLNKTVQKEGLRDGGNISGIKRDIEETQKAYGIAKQKLDELTQSSQQSNAIRQESLNLDAKIQEKEKEISETRGRIATATKEQTEADKNASQAAREKANIQSQVANQEKQVAEAKKQLTTATQQHTDAETKSSRATKEKTMTLDQQASAINTAVQSEKKYTDEVLRQAAAIRSSKEWQEKGHVVVGDVNYYDKERANVSKRDKQLLLSLEEQIVQAQQKEAQEALVAAEAKRQQTQATKEAAQASRGVSSYDLGIDPNVSAGRQRQIESTRAASKETEYLKQQVASLLEVEEREIKTADTTSSSYAQLAQYLKNLQSAYQRLGADRIAKGEGTDLANEIQRTQRAMQKLQQTMSRPVSLKDALGGSEKTLDDLAYKMRRLQSYRGGLNFKTQSDEVLRVNQKYAELQKKMDVIMERNQRMIASNNALGRSWNYMKNRLAFYFTVGASTQFVKNLIEVRSQYEMNERALGILVDSAERGTQIFRELSDMALVSPYTLIELSSAAKQLTAYDVAAKDVVDTTRRLADMASAVGVPVERLTYALGQIKAYGYLNSRDARMFANAGIPLVKELADHYTRLEGRLVSTADIYDRIKKKAIDYNDVMQVMNEMTDEGGKFYDFQAKMADTLKVQLANLTLAWNNMLNDLGNSQQGLLTSGIGALKELFLHWKDLDRILTNLAVTIGTAKAAQLLLNMSFGKGTLAAIKNISAIEGNTAAMYENALSKSNLSKAEARWLVSTNRSNVALRAAMVNMKLLTVEEAKAAASTTVLGVRMGWLGRVMKTNFFGLASVVRGAAVGMEMLGKAMLSIVTNPVFLTITAAMAVTDALLYYNQVAEKTAEMNKAIADNAKEASEAIGDYLKDSVNIGNRAKAAQGVLSVSEGQKAWESIREQIELSSDAASVFISKLLEEEDINKRVKEGFNVAESIREATNAMAGLNAEALKVSQDSWLWGAFGEGLAEDLEDYIEAVQRGRKNGANIGSRYFASGERKEAMDELTAFANDAEKIIRDRLGAGVNDAVQLKEAIERIKKEVIAANPQIKGEVKKWFDVEVDRMMAERFGGVYNELSSIQSQFIEHIKRDSGAALRRLSDDILDTSKELDDDVLGAISKAWDKLKDELPAESQDLISKLQKQMDENPLTLRVLLLQAGEQQIRDAIQKDYEQHFFDSNIGEKPTRPKDVGSLWGDYKGDYKAFAAAQEKHEKEMVEYNQKNAEWEAKRAEYVAKYGDFNKKNDETRAKWAKRVNDEIKAADAEEKAANHAREALESELSLEERKTDARYLSAVKEEQEAKNRKAAAQEAWNYEKLYQEEKGKGRKGSKKDPLLDALKQEISLVEKLQSDYDKLSKSGASQADALDTIRGAYGKTIRLLNAQLQSYGLPQIDISQLITGKDPNKALAHFKQTLDTLVSKGMLTLERSKELEAVVEKFTLSAKTYNLDMITKGLNNELGKLKDEYELAVELDANPEMGNLFADWMGIDMSTLPHTAEEYAKRMTKALNKYLADEKSGIEIGSLLALTDDDLRMFQQRAESGELNQVWVDTIVKNTKEARNALKKENSDIAKDWDNLVQKYAEYEYKIAQVQRNANKERKAFALKYGTKDQKERALVLTTEIDAEKDQAKKQELVNQLKQLLAEIAGDDDTKLKIKVAIDKKELEEGAKVSFEEFQKSPDWIVATGDLAGLTDKAIGGLISSLEEYKKKAKYLDPKQIKQLNKALIDLYKKQKEGNPFKALSIAMMEAKQRVSVYEDELKDTQDELDELTKKQAKSFSAERAKDIDAHIKKIKELKEKIKEGAELKATNIVEGLQGMVSTANAVSSAVGGMWEAFGGSKDVTEQINGVFTVLDSTLEKAKLGAQVGGKWGAIVGAVVGLFTGLGQVFGGGKDDITLAIERSERSVKQLEIAYKRLEVAIEEAYGAAKWGAEQAAIANKKLQLAELKRQLALERSRDSKDRDEGKINDLMGQIEDLKIEIEKSIKDITNDLLGISSVGNAAEELVSSMIDAFRKGEDYMLHYDQTFEDMINNMVMKSIVGRVIGDRLQSLWDRVDAVAKEKGKPYQEQIDALMAAKKANEDSMETLNNSFLWGAGANKAYFDKFGITLTDKLKQNNERIDEEIKKLQRQYSDAIAPTPEDVQSVRDDAANWRDSVKSEFEAYMELFGIKFGDSADGKQLSSLQQGIQSVTETTAGAIEAYMNSVNQQGYLRNDILVQIRDTIQSFDIDVQTASLGQILLQLQASYQVQMSIQGILEGWATPSGQAVRVELVS